MSVATKKRIPLLCINCTAKYNNRLSIQLTLVPIKDIFIYLLSTISKQHKFDVLKCNSSYYNYLISVIFKNCKKMGQTYCSEMCRDRQNLTSIPQLPINDFDQPSESVAKIVKQHITLHSKVKETYLLYRTPHQPQKKGIKLPLYYLFQYSAYYEGDWKNGRPHGAGRLIYDDGSLYEGCFKDGQAECKQALFIKDQSTFYRGSIKHNKANGYGQLSTGKLFYKGHWLNDMPQGKARQIYSSISFYEGQFDHGMKTGEGIYYWNPSQYYIGQFDKNKLEGIGDLTTKEYQYKGQFKQGNKEGKGTYNDFINRFQFRGIFQKNLPKGQGEIIYSDGAKFKGNFIGFNYRKGFLQVKGEKIEFNNLKEVEDSSEQSHIPNEY